MAISTGAALLGSAIIGGVGSAISGSKNSKAINKATAAQTESNDKSVALQREVYGQNKAALGPYLQRGNAAGNAYNALLGLGGFSGGPDSPPISPQKGGAQIGTNFGGLGAQYMGGGNMNGREYQDGTELSRFNYGQPFASNGYMGGYSDQPQANVTAAPQTSALDQQKAAFDQFRNSSGYQFRLNEGNKGLNSAYAGAGTLRSGAAAKAFERYNQDYASNEFGNYMGYLGNQQSVGLQAGSALAGVSQSYANNVTALNGQQAQNIGNAAVAKANNTNSMIGGIASSFGGALGRFGGI